jgi:L-2,4-diaminobutyric acid acetyltransferase
MWQLAKDSGSLDLNSPYSYLLWCRDFAETSIVARAGERLAGFVTGYLRPDSPDTLFVWQVAVDHALRGRGTASRMLGSLADRMGPQGCRYLEATVTPGNVASARLFAGFAASRTAEITSDPLFDDELFPGSHEPEVLFRIGPFG